jgi:hypothetical protein
MGQLKLISNHNFNERTQIVKTKFINVIGINAWKRNI